MGWGGVGWGMLTFACTYVMKRMLRQGMASPGLDLRHEVDATSRMGWGGAC